MVTYDEKLKIVAAFRRVTDNKPPEGNDHELVIVEGPNRLAQLVREFCEKGGNCGDVSANWPNTDEGMRLEQFKDDKLKEIIQELTNLESGSIIDQDCQKYTLYGNKEGSLRVIHVKNEIKHLLVIFPKQLVTHVLQHHHQNIGHPGNSRMRATIELRYWWSGWSNNIEYYVQQCMFCQKRKEGRNGAIPIQEYLGPG
jgi:hypothetical protein